MKVAGLLRLTHRPSMKLAGLLRLTHRPSVKVAELLSLTHRPSMKVAGHHYKSVHFEEKHTTLSIVFL